MANGIEYNNANVMPAESPSAIANPQSNSEVYYGSFASILAQNLGQYVVVEFLIGTNRLEYKEGILYSSGTNFLSLYDPMDDRYIVCDLYAVKFVTFYNTTSVPSSRMRRISQTPGDNYPATNQMQMTDNSPQPNHGMRQNNMYPSNSMRTSFRNTY